MSDILISVEGGKSKRLLTKNKVCKEDIVVTAIGGGGGDDKLDDFLQNGLSGEYTNNRITKVGDYALYYSPITAFNSNSVTEFEGYSLANSSVKSVNAPNAVNLLTHCFYKSNVEVVNLPLADFAKGSMAHFGSCKSLKTIVLPSVTSCANSNFEASSALETADFEKLNSIAAYVFQNCSGLQALILRKANGIVTLSNTVNSLKGTPIANGTGYIYVPKALLSDDDATKDYRRATNWVTYANQFRAIEDYPEICGGVE